VANSGIGNQWVGSLNGWAWKHSEGIESTVTDMDLRPHAVSGSGESLLLVPQQSVMHAGFFTSGRGSAVNMLRFGILIAASVLASSVPSAGNNPFRLRT